MKCAHIPQERRVRDQRKPPDEWHFVYWQIMHVFAIALGYDDFDGSCSNTVINWQVEGQHACA